MLSVVNKKLNMIHSSCFFSLSPSFTKQFSSSAPWQQDYVLSLSSDFQGHGSFLFGKPQNVPWIEWSNTKPLLMPRCCESADVKKKKDILYYSELRAGLRINIKTYVCSHFYIDSDITTVSSVRFFAATVINFAVLVNTKVVWAVTFSS